MFFVRLRESCLLESDIRHNTTFARLAGLERQQSVEATGIMTSARSLMAFRHATDLRLMITEYLDDASAVALKNANNYLRSAVTVENPKHMEPEVRENSIAEQQRAETP